MPQYSLDAPCIRISSRYDKSPFELSSKQAVAGKAKWVSSKDFKTIGGQAALNHQAKSYVPNYVIQDPSDPPILHDFRPQVDKAKFVASKPFVKY